MTTEGRRDIFIFMTSRFPYSTTFVACTLVPIRSHPRQDASGYEARGPATGNSSQKVLPLPTSLSTPIRPPWASTASLQK